MKLAMTIDEALEFADEWSRGLTLYEGAQGWRVVCMMLAEEVRKQRDEVGKLRAFAQDVMQCWPMGDLDGGTLQDAAENHGLLQPETRHEPCGEGCSCAEYAVPVEFADGVTCYRKTPLLMGQTHNAGGNQPPRSGG